MPHTRETIFIGDIHGQASTLLRLLDRLGWKTRDGRLRGPCESALVFVGDLIDGGKENLRSVEIVRELVEQGDALCLMGNHEYNAIQYHAEDPERPGHYLRERSEKNQQQHQNVLDELERRPADKADMLAWFKTLPLAAEGENWRCVHACWHPQSLAALKHDNGQWFMPEHRWVAAAREGQPEYAAVEYLLKGPEYRLPGNATFLDKNDHPRRHARIQWWKPAPQTIGEALLIPGSQPGLNLDAAYDNPDHSGYPTDAPPVFFGHYWKKGRLQPERPNAACVDYSAGKGDKLAAYRLGSETELRDESFCAEPVQAT